MLKALELVGFKSFADRTRFEFPSGISAVVGPNGSGKSNIVDAIKWVLGEQSVKSLRGKEMADVIFNGSGTRRLMNTAEVTLTLDNSQRLLPVDTPEVHLTRRVYRSGEGEYLINRNPARLRDIRDLVSGTGLGTQAYSVIEQGKVDILLQSSPRDRRIIFEEAAGISRFKLRKLEALRRLERVDQNLLRLRDIVDEVENRLRSLRTQAGKARRYTEYRNRLQELRTQVALVDWRRMTERLEGVQRELQAMVEQRDADAAAGEAGETRLLEIDQQLSEVDEAIYKAEARNADNRERIAAEEAAVEHERTRLGDLENEIARLRRQVAAISARSGDFQQQLAVTDQQRQAAEQKHLQITRRVGESERHLTELMAVLDQLRTENEQRRAAYLQQMRTAAVLGNELSALDSRVTAALGATERCRIRLAELDRQVTSLQKVLAQRHAERETQNRRLDQQQRHVAEAEELLDRVQQQFRRREEALFEQRRRHSGLAERIAVLEEFVQRQEGVSAGVKEVLARAGNSEDVPFRAVRGLVADLLNVKVEVAPLVEIALGPAAQYVVAEPTRDLLNFLHHQGQRLSGRVGFLWFDNAVTEPAPLPERLEGRPGVLGRADQFVETSPAFAPLARRLLGKTWFVEKLAHARLLHEELGGSVQFVTLAGELLAADGTLVVGPAQAASGIIARRSELRALGSQMAELNDTIAAAEEEVRDLGAQAARQKKELLQQRQTQQRAADALAELRLTITTAEQRCAQLDGQRTVQQRELAAVQTQHDDAAGRLGDAQEKRRQIDADLAERENRLATLGDQIAQWEDQRLLHGRETTEGKVELAKSEERLRNLDARMRQLDENRQERGRAVIESQQQLAEATRRANDARASILHVESEIADLYLRKESFAGETVRRIARREQLRERRSEVAAEVQKIRGKIRKLEEKIHVQDLAANEIHHERNTLADRIREDYSVELAELEHDAELGDPQQRSAVQEEIDDLRRKINNLGNVNLEALEELEQLEARHKNLSDQYKDLADAKQALEKIIEKINTDSRRLFVETLDEVRGHFQQLFRDLFGGGRANIVLDEGADILESGIEIVARPPGKEPRSISLLSGGEKTLTCVAMLLAIFRSRPSPFCVLDEVDAALDEPNINRFIKVLQNFLTWSQFIIVTHSKKTMTCATTIYGVTMQESGVSKQVSVRFEDVSDDGQILPERLEQADNETQAA